jgi:hypothetical protein
MKSILQINSILEECLPRLKTEYNVSKLGLFGSYVRNEQNQDSDLDILIDFSSKPSLFRFIELEDYLSSLLGVKVDLVMESALKPRIGQYIQNELIML